MDLLTLAQQLRRPSGALGEQVGQKMVEFNADANAWMVSLMNVQPDDRALEIGFGPGETLALLAEKSSDGFTAGIDFSKTMLALAKKRNLKAIGDDRMELQLADALSIPYPNETFTKVCAANVIYFWSDPVLPLKEVHRVLMESGTVTLYVTDSKSWIPGIADTGVFHIYTPAQIEEFLRATGFVDVITHERHIPEGDAYCIVATKI